MGAGERFLSRARSLLRLAPLNALGNHPPRILFVVNDDLYFWSHRLALARAIAARGGKIMVLARNSGMGQRIIDQGLEFVDWDILPTSQNPLRETMALRRVLDVCSSWRPDLIHSVA